MADQQLWAVAADGGYLNNPRLDEQLRHALEPLMRFRQFVDYKPAWGLHKGDTLVFDLISEISTAGGTLIETDTIPEHKFQVARGTITLHEYGNAIPWSEKLATFSKWDITDPVTQVLRRDANKVLDRAAALPFRTTVRKYVPLTTATYTLESSTGTRAANAAGAVLNDYHIKNIIDQLRKWNVPPADSNGNYICIASVDALRAIKDDSNWTDAAKYGDPERLFSGEVGRYYGCRFIEETNVLVNTLGSGVTMGEAVFFGANAVAEGVAVPLQLRKKVPDDYGRSRGMAWYTIAGWAQNWKTGLSGHADPVIHVTSSK